MTKEQIAVPGARRQVTPKPTLGFFLGNAGALLRMKRANRKNIEQQVTATRLLVEPTIPTFEGTGGPMEEGMIYLLFNSEDGAGPIDTVFRVFWVNAPALRFAFLDAFLVSENLSSGQWSRTYPHGILKHRTKGHYHQEVDLEAYTMTCDGTWHEGYTFQFNDKRNHISGDVKIQALSPKGVLVFFNGREAITPSMVQRFYDMFALKATGELKVQGRQLELTNGRAIIEHGLGIFSSYNIYDWRWLNLQFPEGTVHLFYHSLDLGDEGIFVAGEGAAVIDGEWYHFLHNDFAIEELAYEEDVALPTKVPVAWRVTAGKDVSGSPSLDLQVKKTAVASWIGTMGKENEFISNYVLEATGTWRSKRVVGKGTMENQMHRIVE
ncbi:MAG: hypothetical protein SWK90_18905 [Chloroflexota bacterium]|nr:hypothetical protein [Chloroflexota bacterium]